VQITFGTRLRSSVLAGCALVLAVVLAVSSIARPLAAAGLPTPPSQSTATQGAPQQTPPALGQPSATIEIHRGSQSNPVVAPRNETVATAGIRWVELVGVLTLVGAVIYRLFIQHDAGLTEAVAAESADRARRVTLAALVLFVVATLTRLAAQANIIASPSSGRLDAILSIVRETGWGHGWIIGIVGALLMVAGLVAGRGSFVGWVIAGLGVVAIATSEALTGHAAASPHRLPLAVSLDVAHLLGAGGWLGGLVALVLCGLPSIQTLAEHERPRAGSRLVRAYHHATVDSVTVVVVTGLVAAWLRLGTLSALWTTPYGSMLTRKLVFVVVLLALSAYHWRSAVTPDWDADTKFRFKRSATVELLVGGVIVAFTAALIGMTFPTL
jgi:putative copper export protein